MPVPDGTLSVVAAPSGEAPEALLEQGRAFLSAGRPDRALRTAAAALRAARAAGDHRGEGRALLLQASVRSALEELDPEDTLALATSARELLQGAGDAEGELQALQLSVAVQSKWQLYDAAAQSAFDCLQIAFRGGDNAQIAAAHLALAQVQLAGDVREEAFKAAREALRSCGDAPGEGRAGLLVGRAYAASGQHVLSLRAAEEAEVRFRTCGALAEQVDALVLIADAKLNIAEEAANSAYATMTSIVGAAEFALARAKKFRSEDRVCMAAATYTYARMLLRTNAFKSAWVSAKAASRDFRKNGDALGGARALLVWSEADLKLGYYADARTNVQAALATFEQSGDAVGKARCLEIEDDIDRACGLPTQAELMEQQRRQLEYQQQQLLYLQQQQAAGGAQAVPMPLPVAMEEEDHGGGGHGKGGGAFTRTGASPLKVSSGMDVAVIRSKIREIATAIIGEDDVEVDTPLMEAGLTSTNAVILRDELSKDLPGIKLPPTLIFDYPSIGTMADFVIEQAG